MNWRPQSTPKTGGNFTPMFITPVQRFLPSAKNAVVGALLPLHDLAAVNLPGFNPDDPGWKRSVGPWRGDQADASGHLELAFMPAYVMVHSGVGPNNDDVLSPQSRLNLWVRRGAPSDTDDPAVQILNYAKGSDRWKHLTEDKSSKDGKKAAIRFPSTKALFNAVGVDAKTTDGRTRQGALILPKAAWAEFTRLMNLGRMQMNVPQPRDPRWPDYLYGNVTDPDNPLKFRTLEKHSATNVGQKFQSFAFSNNEASLNGAESAPRFTEEMLEKRLFLHDAGLYNIPTYDALLRRIIDEAWYPLELVREALGEKANIGGTQAGGGVAPQAAYAAPQPPQQEPQYTPPHMQQAPPPTPVQYGAPPPPPAPQYAPPPPPPVSEDMFWVSSGNGVESQPMARSAVARRVDAGEQLMLCLNGASVWKSAAESGFVADAIPGIPAAPAFQQQPAQQQAPAFQQQPAPAFQQQPVQQQAPQAAPAATGSAAFVGVSTEDMQGRLESLTSQLIGGDAAAAVELQAVAQELRTRGVLA
jgi:hypothetical protein